MERIKLITSKEYWVETLELMQMQGHTDYDIANVIANKMEEAMNYIPCCKSDSELLPDIYLYELSKLEWLQQTQISTKEQLKILIHFANKLGLYDASDYLKK